MNDTPPHFVDASPAMAAAMAAAANRSYWDGGHFLTWLVATPYFPTN